MFRADVKGHAKTLATDSPSIIVYYMYEVTCKLQRITINIEGIIEIKLGPLGPFWGKRQGNHSQNPLQALSCVNKAYCFPVTFAHCKVYTTKKATVSLKDEEISHQ